MYLFPPSTSYIWHVALLICKLVKPFLSYSIINQRNWITNQGLFRLIWNKLQETHFPFVSSAQCPAERASRSALWSARTKTASPPCSATPTTSPPPPKNASPASSVRCRWRRKPKKRSSPASTTPFPCFNPIPRPRWPTPKSWRGPTKCRGTAGKGRRRRKGVGRLLVLLLWKAGLAGASMEVEIPGSSVQSDRCAFLWALQPSTEKI